MSTNLALIEERIEEKYHASWLIIAYKMVFGLIEVFLGLGLAFFGKVALLWYHAYVAKELLEEPQDLLVNLTKGFVPNVLTHHTFLVMYLLLIGGVKVAGAIGLIYGKNWGVDLLVGLTILLLPFQLVQLIVQPSLIDFFYIFIGLLIAMYLINFQPHVWVVDLLKKVKK